MMASGAYTEFAIGAGGVPPLSGIDTAEYATFTSGGVPVDF